jgi:NADPH:quinone reductase-like Zn-dependent oxidoreductase
MAVPASTWAVWVHEHGGPEALSYENVPLAPLGPQDVLVAVEAASVSGWDLKYRRGLAPTSALPGRDPFPLPQQLGREAAGRVLAVGKEVNGFAEGDRVVGVVHPENPDSPEAIRGLGNLSRGIALPGHQAPGGYAQYLVRDQRMWLPLPDSIDIEQAAVTLWPYASAHRVLVDRLGVALYDTVLVTGATGAMGLATLRLAKLIGARTVAATRYPAKAEALRAAGADNVVLTGDPAAAVAELRELTGGEGVDHAVDYSGSAALLRMSIDAMRLGGGLCAAAGAQFPPGPTPVTAFDLTSLELSVHGVRGARQRDATKVLSLLGAGLLHTPIAARFPLSKAAEAHRLLEENKDFIGPVILIPEHD